MEASANRGRPRGRPRGTGADGPAATIQAVDRAVDLLQLLARGGGATLSDLARDVGLPPSSVHRVLATLETHRLVEFYEATQVWTVGVEAFRIGSAFAHRGSLVDVGRGVIHRLMEETGETANLAIADGADVVFLSQADTPNPIRAFFRAGTRTEMHASGIGKALLAEMRPAEVDRRLRRAEMKGFTTTTLTTPEALHADLERIRARGWSLDDEERHLGMRCVAAPIFDIHGEPVAGVSVSGPTARLGDPRLPDIGARVRAAADEITLLTGGSQPSAPNRTVGPS